MNTVIIYASTHHGNTKKIVEKMAEVLSADLVDITKNKNPDITAYDVIGFGSGIYFHSMHKNIQEFISKTIFSDHQKTSFCIVLQRNRQIGDPVAVASCIEYTLVNLSCSQISVNAVKKIFLSGFHYLSSSGMFRIRMLYKFLLLQIIVQIGVGQGLREILHDLINALPYIIPASLCVAVSTASAAGTITLNTP